MKRLFTSIVIALLMISITGCHGAKVTPVLETPDDGAQSGPNSVEIKNSEKLLLSIDYAILTSILQANKFELISYLFNDGDKDGQEELFLIATGESPKVTNYVFDANNSSFGVYTDMSAAGGAALLYDLGTNRTYLNKTYSTVGNETNRFLEWTGKRWDIFAELTAEYNGESVIPSVCYWRNQQLDRDGFNRKVSEIKTGDFDKNFSALMNVAIEEIYEESVITLLENHYKGLGCYAGKIKENIDDDEFIETVFLLENFSQEWINDSFFDDGALAGDELFIDPIDSGLVLLILDDHNSSLVIRPASISNKTYSINSFTFKSEKIIVDTTDYDFSCTYASINNDNNISCVKTSASPKVFDELGFIIEEKMSDFLDGKWFVINTSTSFFEFNSRHETSFQGYRYNFGEDRTADFGNLESDYSFVGDCININIGPDEYATYRIVVESKNEINFINAHSKKTIKLTRS